MCGIAGVLNLSDRKVLRSEIETMSRMLRHRGPDGTGIYIDGPVGLGHSRLSIIDLDTGTQPIHNEDKTIWVVFNGEIFNYIELREFLEKKGHTFYTKSDTEVIVHLYEEYGTDFVKYMNGQFSIALWDKKNIKLLLVRDRVGITPLFYRHTKDKLIFASEIKSILSVLGESPRIKECALDQLMTFWSPVSPNTIFDNIYEVSPGEMIISSIEAVTKVKYWDWVYPDNNEFYSKPEHIIANELHELLYDATQIRLRSDVPVGAYLSGGLDSSVITALINERKNVGLTTFSIGFEDKGLDETNYQSVMVNHINANHRSKICSHREVADSFLGSIWHTESPILRTAPIPMGILSRLVRDEKYKVVLTGEGSDEVLGGYDIFKETKIRKFWSKFPDSKLRPKLLKRLYPYLDISKSQGIAYLQNFFGTGIEDADIPYFSHLPRWNTTSQCKEFFSKDLKGSIKENPIDVFTSTLPENFSKFNYFNKAQYIEAKSLMSGYLLSSQGDRMLMQNSVEGRFPFLDHRVIEFSNKIDPKLKMHVLNEKYILKTAMRKYLPNEIIERYKQPYRAPDIVAFTAQGMPEYVKDLLSESSISSYGYFDAQKVKMLLNKIDRGRAISYKDNMAFIGILSTQAWHYQFIKNFFKSF